MDKKKIQAALAYLQGEGKDVFSEKEVERLTKAGKNFLKSIEGGNTFTKTDRGTYKASKREGAGKIGFSDNSLFSNKNNRFLTLLSILEDQQQAPSQEKAATKTVTADPKGKAEKETAASLKEKAEKTAGGKGSEGKDSRHWPDKGVSYEEIDQLMQGNQAEPGTGKFVYTGENVLMNGSSPLGGLNNNTLEVDRYKDLEDAKSRIGEDSIQRVTALMDQAFGGQGSEDNLPANTLRPSLGGDNIDVLGANKNPLQLSAQKPDVNIPEIKRKTTDPLYVQTEQERLQWVDGYGWGNKSVASYNDGGKLKKPTAAADATRVEQNIPVEFMLRNLNKASDSRPDQEVMRGPADYRSYIQKNEGGYEPRTYMDTKGIPTIGYGFNLQRSGAREAIEGLGLNYEDLLNGEAELSQEHADQLFQSDYDQAVNYARQYMPTFDSIPENAQQVLVDMMYNMGPTRFSPDKWPSFYGALQQGDYRTAAEEIKNSNYYNQTGYRSQGNYNLMGRIGENQSRQQELVKLLEGKTSPAPAEVSMLKSGGTLPKANDGVNTRNWNLSDNFQRRGLQEVSPGLDELVLRQNFGREALRDITAGISANLPTAGGLDLKNGKLANTGVEKPGGGFNVDMETILNGVNMLRAGQFQPEFRTHSAQHVSLDKTPETLDTTAQEQLIRNSSHRKAVGNDIGALTVADRMGEVQRNNQELALQAQKAQFDAQAKARAKGVANQEALINGRLDNQAQMLNTNMWNQNEAAAAQNAAMAKQASVDNIRAMLGENRAMNQTLDTYGATMAKGNFYKALASDPSLQAQVSSAGDDAAAQDAIFQKWLGSRVDPVRPKGLFNLFGR